MRRDELAALGIELPVLPTIALGALPGAPKWAPELRRIGLDVVASGAPADTAESWRVAAGSPGPAKAVPGDPDVLARAGAVILEMNGPPPSGCYGLGPHEALVAAVDGADPRVEDADEVGRTVLLHARAGAASALWAAATPGLDRLPADAVRAKLAALVEGTRRARLHLAKEQFEP